MNKNMSIRGIENREIVSTRVFNTPRGQVFKAWTDPNQLSQWWGPKGFTSTFHEFDLRPGGTWRFVMHGPKGVNYQNKSIFVDILNPERIIFDHVTGPKFQAVATFSEEGGKTTLTYRMVFKSVAACKRVRAFAVQGNEENFDRLESLLANTTSSPGKS